MYRTHVYSSLTKALRQPSSFELCKLDHLRTQRHDGYHLRLLRSSSPASAAHYFRARFLAHVYLVPEVSQKIIFERYLRVSEYHEKN